MSPYVYAGFVAFVLLMLYVDLKFFNSEPHVQSSKQAGAVVAVWIGLAVAFGIGIAVIQSPQLAFEYFTGYLIEYSLSVDNMFVFIVIFTYFKVPAAYQHRVLFFGILGAIIFRGIFIALGVALLESFEWIIYVFGALLILTAIRIAKGTEEMDPDSNPVLKLMKRFRTTTTYHGQKLFVRQAGRLVGTPLFVVLVIIETTDIVFAIDSIPAIFAITRDPFIVLTSNVFAILGLRSLYFLLAGSMTKFHLLHYGLAVILAFVGVKMILSGFHIHIPILVSLGVIAGVLAATVVLSLKIPGPEPTESDDSL